MTLLVVAALGAAHAYVVPDLLRVVTPALVLSRSVWGCLCLAASSCGGHAGCMILGEGASALVVMELVKLRSGGLGDTPRQREEGPDMWATYVAALGSRSLLMGAAGQGGWRKWGRWVAGSGGVECVCRGGRPSGRSGWAERRGYGCDRQKGRAERGVRCVGACVDEAERETRERWPGA